MSAFSKSAGLVFLIGIGAYGMGVAVKTLEERIKEPMSIYLQNAEDKIRKQYEIIYQNLQFDLQSKFEEKETKLEQAYKTKEAEVQDKFNALENAHSLIKEEHQRIKDLFYSPLDALFDKPKDSDLPIMSRKTADEELYLFFGLRYNCFAGNICQDFNGQDADFNIFYQNTLNDVKIVAGHKDNFIFISRFYKNRMLSVHSYITTDNRLLEGAFISSAMLLSKGHIYLINPSLKIKKVQNGKIIYESTNTKLYDEQAALILSQFKSLFRRGPDVPDVSQ